MNKKIITLILAILFINFIPAYDIEAISINSGQMEFQSDNYQGQIILETPSGIAFSDNYETQIGFLYSTIEQEEVSSGRFARDKGFFEKNRYTCLCFLLFILLLIVISRKKQKVKT